ncbi:Phenolic glucoside malonyltransferase 1 [Linum perenne]
MLFGAPETKIGDLVHEGGIARMAHVIIKVIKELEHDVLHGAKGKLGRYSRPTTKKTGGLNVGIAGSPRFGVYDVDFGFGRPNKVEITSIDKGLAMSMAENGDGSGGVEVGVVMLKYEMEKFTSLMVLKTFVLPS